MESPWRVSSKGVTCLPVVFKDLSGSCLRTDCRGALRQETLYTGGWNKYKWPLKRAWSSKVTMNLLLYTGWRTESSVVHSNDQIWTQNPCCICKGLQVKSPTHLQSAEPAYHHIKGQTDRPSTHSSLIHLYKLHKRWQSFWDQTDLGWSPYSMESRANFGQVLNFRASVYQWVEMESLPSSCGRTN